MIDIEIENQLTGRGISIGGLFYVVDFNELKKELLEND